MKVSFGKQEKISQKYYKKLSKRELFYTLINHDEFPSIQTYAQELIENHLAETTKLLDYCDSDSLSGTQRFAYTPLYFSERIINLYNIQYENEQSIISNLSKDQLYYVLKQYAPSALIDGCWLQNISLAANNHTKTVANLFKVYTDKIGNGKTSKHYGNIYNNLLRSADIYFPEVNSYQFALQQDIKEESFSPVIFQLSLSLFPRYYLPELLGFTLGHFFSPQDRILYSLSNTIKAYGLDDRYCNIYNLPKQASQLAQLMQETVISYLDSITDEEEQQQHWQRIWSGVAVHVVISKEWQKDIKYAIDQYHPLTPHQKMLNLVREKAPYARNMHRHQKIGSRLINDWFAEEPFDAEGFLKNLLASPYINLNDPKNSLLLNQSIDFGGPMFRIFTDKEIVIIDEWIQSSIFDGIPKILEKTPLPFEKNKEIKPLHYSDKNHPDLETYAHCNKRDLYYYFVNADLYPDITATAYKVAKQFFKYAKKEMKQCNLSELLSFFPYSYKSFETRIQHIYETEISVYQEFLPPSTVPREIMVWFTQQYAPFPMVDGSWVQNIAKAGISQTEISSRLFRIYSDEIGNSDIFKNHPNVYRRLLEGEGISMPATDSIEFPQQEELKNFAFKLPLLTLSIAMFPKTFLPEIIGVNLAIELSGLGKGYMEIIDELNYWKIDPYFFTLHLTIDNIASGHTALAMETVHIYLDQVLTTQGNKAVQREWKRIWTGYLAFKQNMTRFDSTLEAKASIRFLDEIINLNKQQGVRENSRSSTVKAG